MAICTFPGCGRKMHARGLCNGHYSQMMRGLDLRPLQGDLAPPASIHREGWAPPAGLSPAWHASIKKATQPAATRGRPCALEACGGEAQHGSQLCPAHHHYREAQQALKARGLA